VIVKQSGAGYELVCGERRTKAAQRCGLEKIPAETFILAKKKGFSDFQIARFVLKDGGNMRQKMLQVRNFRKEAAIFPFIKQIDTLAAEYPAQTNYLYVTYNATESDIVPEQDGRSVIVIGSGAYRIGSSMVGRPTCARTDPSTNSTKECTIDCG